MTIKQNGGVFGRNPTFNDVTIEGQLTFEGDIDISSDLKVSGDLDVTGGMTVDGSTLVVDDSNNRVGVGTDTPDTVLEVVGSSPILTVRDTSTSSATANATLRLGESGAAGSLDQYFDIKATNGKIEFIDQWNEGGGTGTRLTLTDAGSLQINTAGQGIDFSATAGTGTSELLDDYEEGVWTPLISQDGDGAVPFTSVTQSGAYTKVGNLVTVTCLYEYSGIGSVGNNFAYMGGLPFTAADNSIYGYGFSFFEQSAFDTKSYSIAALSNAAKAFFQYDNGGGTLYVGTPRMVGNSFPSAAKVRFTLTYIAV
jgi:hypothetical protein